MGEPSCCGDAAGVVDVGDRTAPRVAGPAPQLHRGADDLVAFVAQQRGGHRRVHPARHGNQHAHQRLPRSQLGNRLGHRLHGVVDVVVGCRPSEGQPQARQRQRGPRCPWRSVHVTARRRRWRTPSRPTRTRRRRRAAVAAPRSRRRRRADGMCRRSCHAPTAGLGGAGDRGEQRIGEPVAQGADASHGGRPLRHRRR